MLRLIRGCALLALAAVAALIFVLFGPFSPLSNQQTQQSFALLIVWSDVAQTTALVASFTAGMFALFAAWGSRRHAWVTLLVAGLVLDAYGVSLFELLALLAGFTDTSIFESGLYRWLSLLGAPALLAVVAFAYAVRFRAEAGPPGAAHPEGDNDALELHYGSLREGEERA